MFQNLINHVWSQIILKTIFDECFFFGGCDGLKRKGGKDRKGECEQRVKNRNDDVHAKRNRSTYDEDKKDRDKTQHKRAQTFNKTNNQTGEKGDEGKHPVHDA